MLLSIALAVASSLSYGFSDFFAGRAAARITVVRTTTLVYLCATAVVALALLVYGGSWTGAAVLWGAIAGVCAIVGFLGFYAGMAAGPMSLVSPLISVLESVVPVGVAIVRGDRLPPLAWVAIVLAMVSALLISLQRSRRHIRIAPRTVVIAVVAGLTLGLSITALDYAPTDSHLAPAFVELAVGLVIMAGILGLATIVPRLRRSLTALDPEAGTSHSHRIPRRAALWMMLAGGILLGVANALLVVALQLGDLAVVSVIVGIYPLATIVLARLVLKERMSAVQASGVGLALIATVLLALSTM
jgi:drug/metabolite transporter (DMT)-like permease